MLFRAKMVVALAAGLITSSSAFAGAVVPIDSIINRTKCYYGCSYIDFINRTIIDLNSTIGFYVNFAGTSYTSLHIDSDGLVFFGNKWSQDVIAPFSYYGDFSTDIAYGNITYEGHTAFAVTWDRIREVGYNRFSVDYESIHQLILVDRSDIRAGDFDFILNYDKTTWGAGMIEGISQGEAPFVGYSEKGSMHGFWTPYPTNYDLPLNSMNSDVPGRYIFEVRNGVVTNPLPVIPEPETWAMLLAGLWVVTGVARRRVKITG